MCMFFFLLSRFCFGIFFSSLVLNDSAIAFFFCILTGNKVHKQSIALQLNDFV